jgi:hypothetical protein
MKTLIENWPRIDRALRFGVELLAQFGLSRQTLAADSVLLPVAYYLFRHSYDENYLASPSHLDDRERLRGWVYRSLVKAGVWGSGLDTLLVALRTAIQQNEGGGFPITEIEAVMAKRGKSLRFTKEEIQDLLDSSYSERRTFALLALLFPQIDVRNVFHVDHVFPRSRFTRARLRDAGVPEGLRDEFMDRAERLANLQLLDGPENLSKKAKLPAEWLLDKFPDPITRANYTALHDLGTVPDSVTAFDSFYTLRRTHLEERLRKLLVITPEDNTDGNEE